jgi:hypothetical protein
VTHFILDSLPGSGGDKYNRCIALEILVLIVINWFITRAEIHGLKVPAAHFPEYTTGLSRPITTTAQDCILFIPLNTQQEISGQAVNYHSLNMAYRIIAEVDRVDNAYRKTQPITGIRRRASI